MKKHLIFLALLPLLLCGLSFGPKSGERPLVVLKSKPDGKKVPERVYSRDILRSDLDEIKNILLTNHPAPYQFGGKDAFDNLYAIQLKKINRPMNAGEYFLVAAPLVEALHCGHTWISLPDDFWNNEEKLFFPLGLIISGDKAYAALSGSNHDIPPGSEILSVNKIPVSTIIESTKKLVNSDAKSKTGKLAIFGYSYPDLFVLQYGNSNGYETEFMSPGKTETQTVSLKPVTRNSAWENRGYPGKPASCRIFL